jgi:hypothetical protein
MKKFFILYWEPGSCGDFIHNALLSSNLEYQGIVKHFEHTDQGRIYPVILDFFKENLEHTSHQWYFRTWSVSDCQLLSNFIADTDNRTFVIPTHRIDQVDFLKANLSNSMSIGVTYPVNMFPLVLKNWCRKTAESDVLLDKIYNQPLHQLLRHKNKFSEFVFSEQLKFGSKIKSSVEGQFDIAISLEDLYNKNLAVINSLFQDVTHVDSLFNIWIKDQSIMHRYHYNMPKLLQNAIGYNSKSTAIGDLSVDLDLFDNIAIKHYSKNHKNLNTIPNFNTLKQALDFFLNFTI